MTAASADAARARLSRALDALDGVLLGKRAAIELALTCLLARGHLLIEDLPGMGKTLLSHALARVLGLDYQRVQFTSDVLPADVIGVSVFDKDSGSFRFVEGPLFAQLVLADEINRATPKSQSALLEAMEERQVTVDGQVRALPKPFFVIATQNPVTQLGTFALPESQLDRFLMRIELGYPDPAAERELLRGGDRRLLIERLDCELGAADLADLQAVVETVTVADPLVEYVQRLVHFTRADPKFALGLSPRGALALIGAARAWAFVRGRAHVVPEDVQAVLPSVVEHRLRGAADYGGHNGAALSQRLLTSVDVV
ncbi:MAG: AAA family ATPase [Planctomycetota bacterium]